MDSYLTPLIERTLTLIDMAQDTPDVREAENRYDLKPDTMSVQLSRGNVNNLRATVSRPRGPLITLIKKNSFNPKKKSQNNQLLNLVRHNPLFLIGVYTASQTQMPTGLRQKNFFLKIGNTIIWLKNRLKIKKYNRVFHEI